MESHLFRLKILATILKEKDFLPRIDVIKVISSLTKAFDINSKAKYKSAPNAIVSSFENISIGWRNERTKPITTAEKIIF